MKKEKDKCHMISLTCGVTNVTEMNLSTKQKLSQNKEQTCGCQGEICGEEVG